MIHISTGDAFADIFCILEDGLPPLGGDVRLKHSMIPVAGGSGVNTSTHLASLVKDFSDENDEIIDVTLQTAFNEEDYYGTIIGEHVKKSGFEVINCRKNKKEKDDETSKKSTGHCIVFVAEGERSFATHLGVIESFKASDTIMRELLAIRTADPSFKNHHHHIHLAGYYNMPGFSNGNLKRRLKSIRDKRRAKSVEPLNLTTTTSLVPQYDATEEWDGGLVDELLPLIDFLILNALEAGNISGIDIDEDELLDEKRKALKLSELAEYFFEKSAFTHVIITLGPLGAVCLFNGEVLASISCPKRIEKPLDPTGAGDAFAAGFLFGVMNWRKQKSYGECAEIGSLLQGSWDNAIVEGMKYGCAAGTACVTKAGASVVASKEEIQELLRMEEEMEEPVIEYCDTDDHSKDEEDSDSSYYSSEYSSQYDSEEFPDTSYEDEKKEY